MAEDVRTTDEEVVSAAAVAATRDEAATSPAAEEEEDGIEDEDDDDDDDEEEEPHLKYAKLTGSLTNVYRNGDSTSASLVAGDKMVLATHNGNVHVLSLPSLQPLRTYHAHSATITSISLSPTPPPYSSVTHTLDVSANPALSSPPPSLRRQATQASSSPRGPKQQPAIPNTPNNAIYIATSSLDGHVCTTSLLDPKDVQLRNFARPLQSVALSPYYKDDRTYLSGGLAGQLILTVGGKSGVTVDANTNSAAAAAGSFLGGLGFGGGDRGRDIVLHSGEGKIGEIKWSGSGRWVVWVNETGIKIMRTNLRLGSEDSDDAWKRIAHAARPNRKEDEMGWEEMAGVWRARAMWFSDSKLEADDEPAVVNGTPSKKTSKIEKLVVGWGDTAWLLHVQPGGTSAAGKRQIGSADIIHKLQFTDCIVSGLSLFTPTILAILAYRTRNDDDEPIPQPDATTKKGRSHRHTGLAPQLRLISIKDGSRGAEIDLDELSISRFETLSAQDYHLNTLYIPPPPAIPITVAQKSMGIPGVELAQKSTAALGELWDAAGGKYATRMFSSSASVLSRSSEGDETTKVGSMSSPPGSAVGIQASPGRLTRRLDAHPNLVEPGLKLFVLSPYDCVLAVKRGLADRMEWLVQRKDYEGAWELVDKHPEVATTSGIDDMPAPDVASPRSNDKTNDGSLAEFFADSSTSDRTSTLAPTTDSASTKQKRRLADLWLHQLVSASRYAEAGQVASRILPPTDGRSWERWVWAFAQAEEFDAITPYIPSPAEAQLPGVVYEVVLGHYVHADPTRLRDLLRAWEGGVYDASSVVRAVEARLPETRPSRPSYAEEDDGVVAVGTEDWRVLTDCLADLYTTDGRVREALRCYIRVQNADAALRLIREEKLLDVVAAEDVPGLLMLRVTDDTMSNGSLSDLSAATSEATALLVEEALRGTVPAATVISQLEARGPRYRPFIFFYLRALWDLASTPTSTRTSKSRPALLPSQTALALLEPHADLTISLFAEYERPLLLPFLRASTSYTYESAASLCERLHYIEELVHILSATGQTKRALFLIIDELADVPQAIAFAKQSPELWNDLLDYGMDKPAFIRGLLEDVGGMTATGVDPVAVIGRIPAGLEVEGLREAVGRFLRGWEMRVELSEGVARVLRGEVSVGMDVLRERRAGGVKFDVGGECTGCGEGIIEDEQQHLLGFPCGHTYHLACFLRDATDQPGSISSLLQQITPAADPEQSELTSRSVGGKVAHAHVIRAAVTTGCRRCGDEVEVA